MGLFSKKQKHRTYVSEEAEDPPDPDYGKRRDPYLVLGDDLPRPPLAGKGLEPNTRYQISRDDETDGYGAGDPGQFGLQPEKAIAAHNTTCPAAHMSLSRSAGVPSCV
jgi:hypothetical protein